MTSLTSRKTSDSDQARMRRERVLEVNERNIAAFRANGGRLPTFGDAPVLLLTTTGSRSGLRRTSPMMYLPDEHDDAVVYVFASAAGADQDPAWLANLVAHPDEVEVERGTAVSPARAEVVAEPRRSLLFDRQAALYPGFAHYQSKTTRVIPVVALTLRRPPEQVAGHRS